VAAAFLATVDDFLLSDEERAEKTEDEAADVGDEEEVNEDIADWWCADDEDDAPGCESSSGTLTPRPLASSCEGKDDEDDDEEGML
jgi:hypothetical protein